MEDSIHYWWWLSAGLVMIAIVTISALDFLLWLGIAAIVTAVISMIWPAMDWKLQCVVYALCSAGTLILWWNLWRNPVETDKPLLNQRGAQYVGRVFTLEQPIVDGFGKVHVGDTFWKVQGADCVAGTKVKVTGVEGTVLLVECIS